MKHISTMSCFLIAISSSAFCLAQDTFSTPSLKRPITQSLGGGVVGGLQDDESQSVWNRVLSFDFEHSFNQQLSQYLQDRTGVFSDPPISDPEKGHLDELIRERLDIHDKNLQELSPILRYQRSEAIKNSQEDGENKGILRKVLAIPVETPEPTIKEVNEMFLRYKKAEIEAEREFAERVCEVLQPKLQEKFFRPLSRRGTQFIVHPFGIEYLGLSEKQVSQVSKRVSGEIAFRSKMIRKAFQENPDVLRKITGNGLPLDDETKRLVSRKHFESLSDLSPSQIVKYLRLRGDIDPRGDIETWLQKKSPDERKIGAEVLQAQLAE